MWFWPLLVFFLFVAGDVACPKLDSTENSSLFSLIPKSKPYYEVLPQAILASKATPKLNTYLKTLEPVFFS